MFSPLPKEIQAAYIAQMNKTQYTETVNQEMDRLNDSLSQLGEKKIHLQQPLFEKWLAIILFDMRSNDLLGHR